jgi:hypothetical protein
MAGDWIKMRVDLADDPAVVAMAASLGIEEDLVVGKLHRLWSWANQQTSDGIAMGITARWIDKKVSRDGFAIAMSAVCWLEIKDDCVVFPKFNDHMSDGAKTRAVKMKQQRSRREAKLKPRDGFKTASRAEKSRAESREEQSRVAVLSEQQSAGPADLKNLKRLLAAERLELNDLKDTEKLIGISQKLAESGYGELDTDIGRQNFLGAAEHALHVAATKPGFKNPLGLFSAIVFDRRWDELTGEQMERSRGRIRKWQQAANGHAGAAGILANAFRSDIPTSPP